MDIENNTPYDVEIKGQMDKIKYDQRLNMLIFAQDFTNYQQKLTLSIQIEDNSGKKSDTYSLVIIVKRQI